MGITTELRQEIKRVFIPYVKDLGFEMDQTNAPAFLEFRRLKGDVVHIFDLQWDKYHRPRFVINFGSCPAQGMDINGRHFPFQKVCAGWTPDRGRLQPGKGGTTSSWFRQDKPFIFRFFSPDSMYSPAEVVGLLLNHFLELETYWTTGVAGPHLKIY